MIISLNWLKQFTKIETSVDNLKDLIDSRLVEVESVNSLEEKYKGVIIAKIISIKSVEGSDHLSLVKIDDGGLNESVQRDGDGLVQVVCGAPNVKNNMLVAWLPPGCIVPATFGKNDEFKLSVKNLRGHVSNGMLASPKELDISDEHNGIFEVSRESKPGDSFAKVYELNDILFDIENKSLTHRPDTFGVIGFAREVAAIQGLKFKSPSFLTDDKISNVNGPEEFSVVIDSEDLSARYSAVVLSGANGALKSPVEIQDYLRKVGMRPINSVVDVTNYLMMLTGQPLHTFDYDKLINIAGEKPVITVRAAKKGEKAVLLDGREIELSIEDIVIDGGGTVIGLAGAMGCANTAIDENTKNILLESATFNLFNLRSTQMRHGIFSEAITRFTKGQPAGLGMPVLKEAIRLLEDWSNANVASQIRTALGNEDSNKSIEIDIENINHTLGTILEKKEIINILENVEFMVNDKGKKIEVTAPFWRADIKIPEDITEEIGRLYGFDKIVPTLPKRKIAPTLNPNFQNLKYNLRHSLKSLGANEVYLYSFVNGNIITKNNQSTKDSYKITNAISPDLQYYRQSILPSLLDIVNSNIKKGFNEFGIFEINKIHKKHLGLNNEKVPFEQDSLAFVYASKDSSSASAYYFAKRYLEQICSQNNVVYEIIPMEKSSLDSTSYVFDKQRSAIIKSGEITLGYVGEFTKEIIDNNKLPNKCAGFELNLNRFLEAIDNTKKDYTKISKYPSTSRDICFQLDEKLSYGQLIDCLNKVKNGLDIYINIEPIDIYKSDKSPTKNVTLKIVMQSLDKTLTNEEANKISDKFVSAAKKDLKAKII